MIMRRNFLLPGATAAALLAFSAGAQAAVVGTDIDNLLFFQGELRTVGDTVISPSGRVVTLADTNLNVNTTTYDGRGGRDMLFLSSFGDLLRGDAVRNVEIFIAGNGPDFLDLRGLSFDTPTDNVAVVGGGSDDVIFATDLVGLSDTATLTISGSNGNDYIETGDTNDIAIGSNNNDTLITAGGDDELDAGQGNDRSEGGLGRDTYIAGLGDDVIVEEGAGETDTIEFPFALLLSDLVFEVLNGDDLFITVGTFGTVTILDQLSGDGVGVEQIRFRDGALVSLESLGFGPAGSRAVAAVPLPPALPLLAASLLVLGLIRRRARA